MLTKKNLNPALHHQNLLQRIKNNPDYSSMQASLKKLEAAAPAYGLTDPEKLALVRNLRLILAKSLPHIKNSDDPEKRNAAIRTLSHQLQLPRFRFLNQIPQARASLLAQLRGTGVTFEGIQHEWEADRSQQWLFEAPFPVNPQLENERQWLFETSPSSSALWDFGEEPNERVKDIARQKAEDKAHNKKGSNNPTVHQRGLDNKAGGFEGSVERLGGAGSKEGKKLLNRTEEQLQAKPGQKAARKDAKQKAEAAKRQGTSGNASPATSSGTYLSPEEAKVLKGLQYGSSDASLIADVFNVRGNPQDKQIRAGQARLNAIKASLREKGYKW